MPALAYLVRDFLKYGLFEMKVAPSACSTNFQRFLVHVKDPLALVLDVLHISERDLFPFQIKQFTTSPGRISSSQQLHLASITANHFSKLKE